jgi:hypothetical protein
VSDSAVLSGRNASSAGGTVTYNVASILRQPHVIATDTEPVIDGVATDSTAITLGPGIYFWQATYSGDARNQPSESAFGSEIEIVLPAAQSHWHRARRH